MTIHPFDDGNGRIARAIADMVLARSEMTSQRFYSMSAQIRAERKAYYEILEATQKGDLDITRWLEWFLDCLGRAIDRAETILATVLNKARFWERFAKVEFNERQRYVQSPAQWIRGEVDFFEVGKPRQVFTRYGLTRHRRSHPEERARKGWSRWAEYVVFTCKVNRQKIGIA